MKRKIKNMEYKKNVNETEVMTVPFEIKCLSEEKQGDEEFFIFEGYASTFGNIDLVDDRVAPGAFLNSIQKETPVILWQHDRFEPIGMPSEIKEDNRGLFLRVRMPKSDTFVAGRVMPQLKIGSVKAMSIGFRVKEFSFDAETGIRTLLEIELREISLVTFPANPEAAITSVKAVPDYVASLPIAKRDTLWDSEKAKNNILEFNRDKETGVLTGLKTDFMFISEGKSIDDFKLPFVDIIDGKKYIIPNALIEIRQMLAGSKGKLDIPIEDKKKIANIVERYVDRLNDEQPKPFYTADDIKKFTKRDLEKCLRDSGSLSKCASVLIASNYNQGEPDTLEEVQKAADKVLFKMKQRKNRQLIENKLKAALTRTALH